MAEHSLGKLALRRFFKHRLAVAAFVILFLLFMLALGAPLSPYSPMVQDPANPFQSPSGAHWFGTDELGRDLFTRILYGSRVSLSVGLISTMLSMLIGVGVGAVSGYYGGWLDNVLMRITDAFLTFPGIFVLIILSSLLRELPITWFRNSVLLVIVIIAALAWMRTARLVRGQVLTLREREFVTATRALGGSDLGIILHHILPNCIGPIVVSTTLQMGSAIIAESGLSFLGFGVQPPIPTWGGILSTAQVYVFRAPWMVMYPGVMIFISVITINYIGDGLRDAFDPHGIHRQK